MEMIVFVSITLIQALRTQAKNVIEKKYNAVINFIAAIIISIALTGFFANSEMFAVEQLQGLNLIDTLYIGVLVGLTTTGSKDLLNSILKGNK